MTFRLDDPRLAAELVKLVDRRVDFALQHVAPQTRYGIVSAVDSVNHKASVMIGGSPDASPGFAFPPYLNPLVGDTVRVVTRGADRYVEAVMTGTPPAPAAHTHAWSGREVTLTAAQSLTSGTWTRLTGFSGGRFRQPSADYGIASSCLAVPATGLYLVVITVDFAGGTTAAKSVGPGTDTVGPSGTQEMHRQAAVVTGPSNIVRGTFLLPATAGQLVGLWAWQNSGGAVNANAGSSLSVVYLGPTGALAMILDELEERRPDAKPATSRRRRKVRT